MDGDMMENLEDYKYKYQYFGTRNGYRYLDEIIGKEIEDFIINNLIELVLAI